MNALRRQSDRRPSDRPPARSDGVGAILFVDDEPAVCRAFRRTVERYGYEVVTASSAAEAIQICQRRVFATVVTDLRMPGLSGFGLIERLAASQPELTFVLATGMPDLDLTRASVSDASVLGVVSKPWDEAELIALLERATEVTARRRRPRSEAPPDLPRVLVIEDEPFEAELVKHALRGHASQVVWTESLRSAEMAAASNKFDVVLIDLALSDARGLDALVRMKRLTPHAALLVLSGRDDPTTARQAIRAGAHDYLLKGLSRDALGRAVMLGTERARVASKLRQLAHRDALTGLANRRTLRNEVSRARTLSQSLGGWMGLFYIDLDRFKLINDSLGHDAGDEVLQEVSRRLRQETREIDTVARIGGDEFAVMLPQLDGEACASTIAERIVNAMQAPFELSRTTVTMTCSVGMACQPAGEVEDLDDLLRRADRAMYSAKRSGRNQLGRTTESTPPGPGLIHLENELRHAAAHGGFELAFQPQVHARAGHLYGYEMLLRWSRANGTPVSPEVFIPMLEDLGLIAQVGRWARRKSCERLAEWRRQGLDPSVRMAANVSGQEFETDGLVESVGQALEENGLEPSCLELEITEGVLMRDTERTNETLEGLRRLGVRLAIDDFGTGYSSLAYLQRFRVNQLKVDRCFVSGQAAGDYSIAEAVISLGHRLGMEVVAEGIENPAQQRVLEAAGCDVLQGYLLGRPGAGWEPVPIREAA
ncbi:MAG: EAL domain-containing protein [Sandaracinaceae bacterium]